MCGQREFEQKKDGNQRAREKFPNFAAPDLVNTIKLHLKRFVPSHLQGFKMSDFDLFLSNQGE